MLRALVLSMLALAGVGCTADSAAEPVTSDDALTSLGPEAYRAYATLAAASGAAPAPGTVTVLGLRGLSVDGAKHGTSFERSFDDTLIVLGADGVTALRFAASTHPFERKGVPGVPDVNGDRVADVGMIRPGVYDVAGRDRLIAGAASFVVTQGGAGKLPGWRDVDHDGLLTDDERAASERRNDGLTDVLFHQGEGAAPPAVGCQVLPASAIRAFTTAVGGGHARFRYVLVDMTGADTTALLAGPDR
jgi:hypothetical protein